MQPTTNRLRQRARRCLPAVRKPATAAALAAMAFAVMSSALAGCSRDDTAPADTAPADTAAAAVPLSSSEIAEIVRAEIALAETERETADRAEDTAQAVDVDALVEAVLAQLPEPEAGLTASELDEAVERMVTAALSSNDAPDAAGSADPAVDAAATPQSAAEHTKLVVEAAISRYETSGLQATADHYNDPANIDGQWYVFIVDVGGEVLVHFDPTRRHQSLHGWVGTDSNGYRFGPDMLAATEEGKWVTYVYRNPETADPIQGYFGDSQVKNAWVKRHDGLLFASGWYAEVETYMKALVGEIMEAFTDASGSLSSDASPFGPGTVASGLASTLEYYNNTAGRGQSLAFVATSGGEIVSALGDPELPGRNIAEVLGPAALTATPGGVWIIETDNEPGTGPSLMRVWLVEDDGHIFGAGWYEDTPS